MKKGKQAEINKLAFIACKSSLAIALWLALFLQLQWLIAVNAFILLASALLKIQRAPLIMLYTPFARKINTNLETVDEAGIAFAQSFGALLHLVALCFLFLGGVKIGWIIVIFLAILKTISVFGFCTGLKLYECLRKGGCCSFLKKNNG